MEIRPGFPDFSPKAWVFAEPLFTGFLPDVPPCQEDPTFSSRPIPLKGEEMRDNRRKIEIY
jgi:hypothetical protein